MEMPKFEDSDIANNKIVAALSYVFILFLIPLLLKRDSKFCQWHAKQGLTLFLAGVVVMLVGWIPLIGWLFSLAVLVAAIIGIVKTLNGQGYEIPVIGQYADKFNI